RAMRNALALLVLLCLLPAGVRAQPGADEQLAVQYYQQGDYEKAVLYYEKLYRQQPNDHFYEQLLKSLIALKDLDAAEKLVKDRQKSADRRNDPRFPIDLGNLYRLGDQGDKAAKEFDKALKLMRPDEGGIRQTANHFVRVNEYDMALQAYERGQRMARDGQTFHYEIANLYVLKGDTPK